MNRPGDWNCRTCKHMNFQRRESCQRCGEPRGATDLYSGGGGGGGASFGGRGSSSFGTFTTGPDVRPGDWYCTVANCGAHNFASRSSCFKCGASKEDSITGGGFDADMPRMRGFGFGGGGGGVGGGGSSTHPGWKSGDWLCSRSGCNEHNFANRMECYRCNAPRDSNTARSPYQS
ncbi:hypothetical protein Lal_00001978 [Lupinus albus]|uniref:Putative Zinc finger, RanBP2-type n=1 Tax=Lupinus albus TaxID=3870 RepID=A0A6A5P7M1_LUPAL|nr:putative Zinc finger, RanBP2-type [Lupinus albus]KAF1893497.1 hypothetical protein Lal_00001978 [Lupinus albus]